MTYQFYITDDIPHGDSVYEKKPGRDFLPFEKFLLNNKTNNKTINKNYDDAAALQIINTEIDVKSFNTNRIDPSHVDYDHKYARIQEYGPLVDQIEFITENGLEAWQARVAGIKNLYPKPNK